MFAGQAMFGQWNFMKPWAQSAPRPKALASMESGQVTLTHTGQQASELPPAAEGQLGFRNSLSPAYLLLAWGRESKWSPGNKERLQNHKFPGEVGHATRTSLHHECKASFPDRLFLPGLQTPNKN
jgi:hypothetical protein